MPETPTLVTDIHAQLDRAALDIRGTLDRIAAEHDNLVLRNTELSRYASSLATTLHEIQRKLQKYAEPGSTAEMNLTDLCDAHDLAAQAHRTVPGEFKQASMDAGRLEFLMAHFKVQDRATIDNMMAAAKDIAAAEQPPAASATSLTDL